MAINYMEAFRRIRPLVPTEDGQVGGAKQLWPGLTRFLNDPAVPLENRATERALRGPVGRQKTYYGARSRRGTEVAALYSSLIETAKLLVLRLRNQGNDPLSSSFPRKRESILLSSHWIPAFAGMTA